METINNKLSLLKQKINNGQPIVIMIIGLGSVGCYLLDYLVSLGNPSLKIVVVGRNREKMQMDVNIIRTASTIRQQLRSEIKIVSNCDLNDVDSIASTIENEKPDFVVNASRVYSGLKYGSISWKNLRAYGIWAPLSAKYAKNIMEAYTEADSNAISINTSYSDAVIPWQKSAGKTYFDFGSGNLNHLVPRMKFFIAEKFGINNLNDIDVTLAVSHFHDVVISKEGQTEGQEILLDIKYQGEKLDFDKNVLLRFCPISMPVDQKRNMMNASSNFRIITSILESITNNKISKIHSPGAFGEIGGYPVIIDGATCTAQIDTSLWSMEEMRTANRKSILPDGIENVENGVLYYSDGLINKVKQNFNVILPKSVNYEMIDEMSNFLIKNIIEPFGQK